ncbi:unnamed protein product [Heterosigma akashiwo]
MQDSIAEAQAKMTGCWEMESQENYGAFLQYVCKLPGFIMSQIANQTYKQTFTFNGSIITIAIDGARKTSTDFEVGAEPIQIDMNKRKCIPPDFLSSTESSEMSLVGVISASW